MLELNQHPHLRRNALTDDWVLVSPHRDITAESVAAMLRSVAGAVK